MADLKLARPKRMDVALPANLRCGRGLQDGLREADRDWAPLACTFAGFWEITLPALPNGPGSSTCASPRNSPDRSATSQAQNLFYWANCTRAQEIAREVPIVTICCASSRSAQAYNILRQAGFTRIANLSGGMLRWRPEGLPVEGGCD